MRRAFQSPPRSGARACIHRTLCPCSIQSKRDNWRPMRPVSVGAVQQNAEKAQAMLLEHKKKSALPNLAAVLVGSRSHLCAGESRHMRRVRLAGALQVACV